MDHRGHPWPESGHHYSGHRQAKDREDHGRLSQQVHAFEPRERERQRPQPDARYRNAHYASPHARPEQYPYSYQQYPAYGYGPADYHRPQSRHGYDYPPHSQWDYRDSYGYYDQDYYRGQHAQQDAGQWTHQDSWRPDGYHDHGRDNSLHHHLSDYEETPSRDNEEVSSYHLGTLESSKASGLSSSSYELSQYMNGGEHGDSAPHPDAGPVLEASAPLKYSIPHAVVSFGPAGQLMRVTPGFSTQKNVSQVEIHSLEVILSETQEQQEMRNFPGPLTREDLHKVDAVEFAQQEAGACMRDDELQDKSSAALLWNLLILLCRQNGQIVGSDIAELLMQGSRPNGSWESGPPTLIDFSEGAASEAPPAEKGDDLLTGDLSSFSPETSAKALQSYTQLLLAGRKKEALESAMSSGLWGHALFLASKMDNRSYTSVLTRFTGQLTASDPLQTLFQLLSGRIPAVATCCGHERAGDWRPHLAVMLSNETGDAAVQRRAIITMGDTLASRGLLYAAHVCYLTAGVPFGAFTRKAERLVLLGSSHRRPFAYFATNAAIQCTELYEYCQTLGDKGFSLPSFQVYKFLYASRLLDCGLSSQAFYYCEVVGQALLRQREEPLYVLTGEVIKMADRLRHSEGQFSEGGVSGADQEPDWLRQLRARYHSLQTGSYNCTETYRPEAQVCALAHVDSRVYPGSDDLHSEIQSPEPELLYYRGDENQESLLNRSDGGAEEAPSSPTYTGAQHWPVASPPIPATAHPAPPPSTVAPSQDSSYHNTDSAEVRGAAAHCSPSDVPPAAGGARSSSGTGAMLGMDTSHRGQDQHSAPPRFEAAEQMNEPLKQDEAKGGWFSGWFTSKGKENEQRGPAPTGPPPNAHFHPPPPPAMVSPNTFPSQPSAAGINPFSRKAGQQLG